MSLHLEMLQVARLAPKVLGEASELVAGFLREQLTAQGGFGDREGRADLYYTVFGLDSLLALEVSSNGLSDAVTGPMARYVESWAGREDLDFVHLCCLARCRAGLRRGRPGWDLPESVRKGIRSRIQSYRTLDGGFNPEKDAESGTAYGAFLGLGAMQDLGSELEEAERLVQSLRLLARKGGGFANETRVPGGSTTATAAVVAVMRNLAQAPPAGVAPWLASMRHVQGGFKAGAAAPLPDLLSTATALHALSGLEQCLDPMRESCLNFLDSLWTNRGGFHGHWADDDLDVEYTFYGLLALGHLG